MGIELFNISYRPALHLPAVSLLCQAMDHGGEKFLWVDGVDVDDPIMVPFASVRKIEWAGSFKEFMASRLDLAKQVIDESQGDHSPTIMARAMLCMSRDVSLTALEALDLVHSQGVDLIDADNMSAQSFSEARVVLTPAPAY